MKDAALKEQINKILDEEYIPAVLARAVALQKRAGLDIPENDPTGVRALLYVSAMKEANVLYAKREQWTGFADLVNRLRGWLNGMD